MQMMSWSWEIKQMHAWEDKDNVNMKQEGMVGPTNPSPTTDEEDMIKDKECRKRELFRQGRLPEVTDSD